MADTKYTSEQRAAIDDRGGDLLVAAAAGSGKTRVLVERLLDQVEAGADLNEFLIITFTRAAAAELKGRILEEIGKRLAKQSSAHLRRQSALLYSADIDTIHAFCGKMIREFAHILEISPDFRMADESEGEPMRRSALEDVLEDRYARLDAFPGFAELADTVSAGQRDTALMEVALDVHQKLLSHAAPEQWAMAQVRALDVAGLQDASETIWGKELLCEARVAADYWYREMATAQAELLDDERFYKAYGPAWGEALDGLSRFLAGTEQSWDAASAALPVSFPRANPVKGEEYDRFKHLWRRCKEAIPKLAAPFDLPSAELFEDMAAVRPVLTALVELVLDMERAYQKEKKRRGVLDFSDLEHLAIRLLMDRETGAATPVAEELAGRYTEVMVDEFQDVSGLQDEIFRALNAYGSRRFMVGDVKQSIYRFRLADPLIFLGYYKAFADPADAETGAPRKILLSKNFRSRPGVLDAVNFLFRRIMSESFGEMAYGDREALYPGKAEAEEDAGPAVLLDILDKKTLPKDGTDARDMAEARHIAAQIRKIHDKEGRAWGDFAILLRSRKKATRFEQALEELDIPVAKSGGADFFYTVEIASLLSLLTVTLNPLQDVPLIGALRSPLFDFSPDDLAGIRLGNPEGSFFEAMERAAPGQERCAGFLADLARWRDMAPDMTVDQFLWYLVHETGALTTYTTMARGETRRQNLFLFLAYARSAAERGCKSLFDFITQLEKRLELGDPPQLTASHGAGNAVTIMSVHKSKGLEFPVVFLPDLSKRFRLSDAAAQILVHPRLGLGCVRRDLTRKIRYPTLPQLAIRQKIRQESLAEELRILYVAMTRAEHKLILTIALDNAEKTMADLRTAAADPVPPAVLAAQSSIAPWILLPTLAIPNPPWQVRPIACGDEVENAEAEDDGVWQARPREQDTGTPHVDADGQRPPLQGQGGDVAEPSPPTPFAYPHPEAPDLPSKVTATELKGRRQDKEAESDAVEYKQPKRPVLFRRPGFIDRERPLTPAQRGTATHLVMQYIDFSRCTDLSAIEAEVARLAEEGRITAQSAQAVDGDSIWRFFKSPLGQRVLAAEHLRREFKFSLLVSAQELLGSGGEEQILLQGVIDCYLEESDGLVLLDFKTDHVPSGGLEAKAAEYTPQMEAYTYALEQITGRPVKEVLLYFFGPGESVTLQGTYIP